MELGVNAWNSGTLMTRAVCIECGEAKDDPIAACPECGFAPGVPEEQARSLLLSEHHRDAASLDAAALRLRAGEDVGYDAGELNTLTTQLREHPIPVEQPLGCRLVMLGLVLGLTILALGSLLAWMYALAIDA